ncbi:uncharacterized protein LOC117646918 [Thrips palmi]|uniref:Uncharacterized protein LOC117646918 n=1 Tax=Thrips palmi TaxID=161013 RepID=A0A6P8Z395_THRPL|nr:uncharacterized protein LOC117646918 [Thrips palmi]
MTAQTVFRVRGGHLRKLVLDTASIVADIESGCCEESQACLARARRADSIMRTQNMVLGGFLLLSILLKVIFTGRSFDTVWPKPPGEWGELSVGLLQLGSAMFGTSTYYIMCALVGCLGIWIAGMYRALAVQFKAARSKDEIMGLVKLHQRLQKHARATEVLFADVLMHLFLCCFVCPLTSTIDVLLGEITAMTFSSAPLIVSVFLPFSHISQELIDSSTAIGSAAFWAAFESDQRQTQEDLFVRRALLLTIVSSRRPAQLSCRGLGPLSLGAAANALRTWYSLVNMVIGSGRNIKVH